MSVRLAAAYSAGDAAALYDVLNPPGADDDFYLDLVRESPTALDVGCGTGRLLRQARDAGHTGRLLGADPDPEMLALARRTNEVEWIEATAASLVFDREFDLIVMMGHAFQCLVSDEDVRASLAAIRRALTDHGAFAFETRNPDARAWEEWATIELDVIDPAGRPVRVSYDVETVDGDVVTLTEITSDRDGVPLRRDRTRLRFLDVEALDRFLVETGFVVEARYGDWGREPFTAYSPEIITVARCARDGEAS